MKQIILYGHLAKKFGRHHRFDVRTPAEAIKALQANFPDFKAHILEHSEPGYRVRVGNDYRDPEGMHYPADGVIKIVPVVAGAGKVGQIIVGAILLVIAYVFPVTAQYLVPLGLGMIIGGVSQLLFAPPKPESTERAESKPSYSFDGPINTSAQGNPVPVCYGRLRVGSQVVSASLTTDEIPMPPEVQRVKLPWFAGGQTIVTPVQY